MPFLIYRDKMRSEGLNHYPYTLGMALNEYRINIYYLVSLYMAIFSFNYWYTIIFIIYNMQIMTKVYILSCFMPFLAYRDKKRANGPISLSLYPRNGIKQDRIDTEVIICFISQSGHQNILIIRWLQKEVSICQNSDFLL